ncbi:proteolytic complex protein LbcA [Methyloparacoccus murrellii]
MPSVVKQILYWMVTGVLWASGCAGVHSSPESATQQGAAGGADPAPPEGAGAPIYLMLVGEVAGQRGQFDVALNHYLELARLVPDGRVAERATQIALYVKNADKALEAASMWAEREPRSLPAHRIRAMLQIKAGDTGAAAQAFGRLLELKDPELENTLVELVRWMDSELPKEQGLQVMQTLAEKYPRVAEIHFAYALLASNKDAAMTARVETDRALAMRPGWSRALMLRAQLMMQAGDNRAARIALEKALKGDPENPRVALLYAQFLAKTGDLKAAERELKRIVGRDPGNHDARFALASVWFELGQLDRARTEFQALSGDQRWQAQADFSLGLIDARQGHAERALRQFDRVGAGPLEFDARFNGISALISLGRHDEARQRLAAARQSYPHEKTRLYLIEAEMLAKDKHFSTATSLLGEALREQPGQPELLYARALLAEQAGQLDVMEADLRAVLQQKPDDAAALNALGFSLAEHRLDRLDEAEGYIRQALEKRPGDPAVLDSYGWVLYRKGKPREALAYLRKAYGLFADPEIAAHLGEVLWTLGRREEARRIWSEGYAKNPEQDDIRRVREKFPDGFRGAAK